MIKLNVAIIRRWIREEVESVFDYGLTDLNLRLGVKNLTNHLLIVESLCFSR